MEPGDIIEIKEPIIQGKKKSKDEAALYAQRFDMVQIISVGHYPILLVHHYGQPKNTFPVHASEVTTELHPKNTARLKKDREEKKQPC